VRPTRARTLALGAVLVVALTGLAAPAMSGDETRPLTFTVYEVAENGIVITDETPHRIVLNPPGTVPPVVVTPLPNPPVPGAAGVGDDLLIDSTLYRDATFVNPPEAPFPTFQPVGDPIGDVIGDCTFVRVELTADRSVDDRLASCEITFRLPQGDLVAGGTLDVTALEKAEPARLAILGGTDLFKRARGTVTLEQPSVPAFDRFTVTVDYRL
jgi:hypothetical protein